MQETNFVQSRENGHFLWDSENIFGRAFHEKTANGMLGKQTHKSEVKRSFLGHNSFQCLTVMAKKYVKKKLT